MVRGLGWRRILALSDLHSIRKGDGNVYWCELESDSSEVRNRFEALVMLGRRNGAFPRICVLARSNRAKSVAALRNREGVRVGVWANFVTLTDSRVVIERIGRKQRWAKGYVDVMGAVISQLVRNDLGMANYYATVPLRDILADSSVNTEDIWSAQVQVLFPKINFFRRAMIRKYSQIWHVPWDVEDEKGKVVRSITDIDDLEVGHLWHQARDLVDIDDRDRIDLRAAKDARHSLAHLRVLDWQELSSDFGARVFDIRAPKTLGSGS